MSDVQSPPKRRIENTTAAPHPLWVMLGRPLLMPVMLFEGAFIWLITRRWLRALMYLPAIALAGWLLGLSLYGMSYDSKEQAVRYLRLADEAEAKKDDKALELHYRRLLRTELDDALRFKVASFLASQGRLEQARQQMSILAPDNGKKYAKAHLWTARDIARQGKLNQESVKRLEHHAKIAATELPEDAEANTLYSQLLIQLNRGAESLPYLDAAAEKNPNLLLPASAIHAQLGNKERSRLLLSRATIHYRNQVESNPKNIESRLSLSICLIRGDQLDAAIDNLRNGLIESDDQQLRTALADCYVQKFDLLKPEDRVTSIGLAYLQQSLLLAPNHTASLERIAGLIADSPESDWGIVKERLEQVLADGSAPAAVHVVLADGYLRRNEHDKAMIHFEQAYQLDPRMLIVLNNLAWLIAHSDKPDYQRAEDMINKALEVSPNHIEMRETKGQILIKAGKFREGISELERVLQAIPNRKSVRLALADAYDKIGEPGIASKYREAAAKLP